ncbi:hypothetical protein ACLOJK_001268 [Asimina triloba]
MRGQIASGAANRIQQLGVGTLHACDTFLAFSGLMYFFRAGSFRYLQRQDFCSLSLLQHAAVGGEPRSMEPAQGLSSVGLHVTDMAVGTWPTSSSASIAHARKQETFIFL